MDITVKTRNLRTENQHIQTFVNWYQIQVHFVDINLVCHFITTGKLLLRLLRNDIRYLNYNMLRAAVCVKGLAVISVTQNTERYFEQYYYFPTFFYESITYCF